MTTQFKSNIPIHSATESHLGILHTSPNPTMSPKSKILPRAKYMLSPAKNIIEKKYNPTLIQLFSITRYTNVNK